MSVSTKYTQKLLHNYEKLEMPNECFTFYYTLHTFIIIALQITPSVICKAMIDKSCQSIHFSSLREDNTQRDVHVRYPCNYYWIIILWNDFTIILLSRLYSLSYTVHVHIVCILYCKAWTCSILVQVPYRFCTGSVQVLCSCTEPVQNLYKTCTEHVQNLYAISFSLQSSHTPHDDIRDTV